MNSANYVQIVRQTWDERFKMYMKCSKKELATMLAERDKHDFPDQCTECEGEQPKFETYDYSAMSIDSGAY